MSDGVLLELGRDCEAVQIPAGNRVVLPAGTEVEILQNLGGDCTVRALGGLFQVSGVNADALGLRAEQRVEPAAGQGRQPAGPVEEKVLWDALRTCYDPEIPVNLVDLGLIYDLAVESLPGGGSKVAVKMTLTAPGCGMGPFIAQGARDKLLTVPGVQAASVEIVWDPPWHQSMITAEGRRILGFE